MGHEQTSAKGPRQIARLARMSKQGCQPVKHVSRQERIETDRRRPRTRRSGSLAMAKRALWTSGHFTANTYTAPPCGTSGYLPGNRRFMRDCIVAGSTPQPDCTEMYCLPSTSNDTGTAAIPEMVGVSQRILPVLASKARNMRSLVPPANSTSPAVASTGPQLNDGRLVVHTLLPVSTFHACSSPLWSAPATISH